MKKLCIVNAPEDDKHRKMMLRHLTMMVRNQLLEVVEEVNSSEIVCILMSNDMLTNDRAWALGEQAKRRRAAGGCHVVPILVEPMAELPDFLALLAALPRSGKPAKSDEDWALIAGEIRWIAMRGIA